MSPNLRKDLANLLIAAGSNQYSCVGDPACTVTAAREFLVNSGVVIRKSSRDYRSPAFPAGSGPDFVNAVWSCEYAGSPEGLLGILHDVEAKLGRSRTGRWAPRTLDLDLLAFGERVLPSVSTVRTWIDLPLELQAQAAPQELVLPHPRLQDRAFVLVPLLEIAPDWLHPVLKKSVREMHSELPGYLRDEVIPLEPDHYNQG